MVTDIKMPEAIIIALDFDEYWIPLAVVTSEEAFDAAANILIERIVAKARERYHETHDTEDGDLPFDEEAVRSNATDLIIRAPQKVLWLTSDAPIWASSQALVAALEANVEWWPDLLELVW